MLTLHCHQPPGLGVKGVDIERDMETLTTNAAVRVEPGLPPERVEAGAGQLGHSAPRPLRGQHPLPAEKHCHHHLNSDRGKKTKFFI